MNTALRNRFAPAARRVGRAALAFSALALLLSACAGGAGAPNWSFMPPGPTPEATPPTGSPAPTPPTGSPAPTDGQADVTFETETPPDNQLAFVPDTFTAPPGATIRVNYLNNTNIPHNIHFFAGSDQNAPSIAATDVETGPDNAQTVTFTAPEEPGDYYFHCDVHPVVMAGTLTVGP